MATRGQRRHLALLENPTTVPDGVGGYTTTFTGVPFASRYAEIKPATARDMERVTVGTVESSEALLITMDFHSDVTTQTRVSWTDSAGRPHMASVSGVTNPEMRCVDLILTAVEMVS